MKKYLLTLIILLNTFYFIYGQRTVQGTVSDEGGSKIIGANIVVKGTLIGAVSDIDGKFSLQVPKEKNILIFSYTGYETKEIELGISNTIEVVLSEGVLLETAVITALGISREKKSLGYAVSEIDGSELNKIKDPNIVNQLSGRAAGLTVVGSNGNFGSSARITIRGLKSISGNNQPLFVVDGVPMDNSNFTNDFQLRGAEDFNVLYNSEFDYGNSIQDLNTDDIDNISILKGQAAAALYGSRGMNGVIMVTTKKGGKVKKGIGITVNTSYTFDQVAVFPKFQNKYGGGVDLLPRGYSDNSGYYKTPYIEFGANGDTIGTYQSFDLVPIYAVDESKGIRFATSTDEQFKHLDDFTIGNNQDQYQFINGYGNNQDHLFFRDWNSWDAWDSKHYGTSRLWEVGDNPVKYFETGLTSNQSIAFEGGDNQSSFRLAYNRFDQKGIYPNSNMYRNTFSFNGSHEFTKNLQTFLGVNYINSYTKGRSATTYDARGGFNPAQNFSQWWHTDLRFSDLKEYLNPDGSQRTWNRRSAEDPFPQYWDNPYWVRYNNYEDDGRDRVFGNVGLTYKFNSWLSATGRVLTDFYDEKREERIAVGSLFPSQYTLDEYHVKETNTDLIIRAEHNLFAGLSMNAFVGGNKLWHSIDRNFSATIGGLNVPGIYRIQNSIERPYILNVKSEKEIESLFAGLSLGWKDRYYLDLSGRQDWSSTLPDNANGYFYPAASLSYVFTEQFNIPFLSFGKIRIGVANVGGDTDPYNIYSTYEGRPNFGNNPNYTVPNTLNNDELKPENTQSIEFGTELLFFKNRLGLDLTVYAGKTKDQIIPLATSPTSGFTKQFINAGEISNKGIEISLHAVPLRYKKFSWDLIFNWGKNVNKIVSIIPNDPSIKNLPIGFDGFGGVSINALIDQPYGTIFGTNYVYDKKGNKLIYASGNFKGTYIASTDVMPIGNITPDFTGGFINTFSWRGWSLNILIDFRKGGDIYSQTNSIGRYSGLLEETAKGEVRENGMVYSGMLATLDNNGQLIQTGGAETETKLDDTYQSTGEVNNIATQQIYNNGGNAINKTDVYDGSFIKLRELSLSYTFPKSWLMKEGIQDFTISIVSRNLAILYKNIPNIDPDSAISTSNFQGIEGGATPTTRSLGINLNFKF